MICTTSLPTYSRILVPTDGSEYSFNAGRHAVYLARELMAKLYVLNVIDEPLAFHAGIHYAESKAEMEQSGRHATDKIKALCDEAGVECETLVLEGKPQDVILGVADEAKVDCIVMGSIGMSAIERVLMGSVSDAVVRRAKCPVLIIKK